VAAVAANKTATAAASLDGRFWLAKTLRQERWWTAAVRMVVASSLSVLGSLLEKQMCLAIIG
jgi:hypothetical protein